MNPKHLVPLCRWSTYVTGIFMIWWLVAGIFGITAFPANSLTYFASAIFMVVATFSVSAGYAYEYGPANNKNPRSIFVVVWTALPFFHIVLALPPEIMVVTAGKILLVGVLPLFLIGDWYGNRLKNQPAKQ